MAFGVTIHCIYKNDVDAASFATDSGGSVVVGASTWTPTANTLQVVIVNGRRGDGSWNVNSITGHGLTYSEKVKAQLAARRGIFAWTAIGGSPTNGALTVNLDASIRAIWIAVLEISGIDTGDPTGVSASVTDGVMDDGDTITCDLAAFSNANNMTFTAAGTHDGVTSFNIESGYTEHFQDENTEVRITIATKTSEDDPTFTLDTPVSGRDGVAVAFEIKAAGGGLSPPEIITMLNRDKINPIRLM